MRIRSLLLAACAAGIGSACAADPTPVSRAGYATVHDTMPDSIHQAMHHALERTVPTRSRGKGIYATDSRLTRIANSNDAWLEFDLVRDTVHAASAIADTVTLVMNCNADSMVVLNAAGHIVTRDIVIAPHARVHFARDANTRMRVYGLRPILPGKRPETLVRMAVGGDLVLLSEVLER